MRRPGRAALIAGLLVLAVLGLGKLRPWLTAPHAVTDSTPALGGIAIGTHVPILPGTSVCVANAVLTPDSRQAVFVVTSPKVAQPLEVIARTGAYRGVVQVPADYPTDMDTTIFARFKDVAPSTASGSVCVKNRGKATVSVIGTEAPGPPGEVADTTAPSRPVQLSLTLYGKDKSIAGRIGTMTARAAAFASLSSVTGKLIMIFALIGIPLAAVAAVAVGFARDEPRRGTD